MLKKYFFNWLTKNQSLSDLYELLKNGEKNSRKARQESLNIHLARKQRCD